MLLNISWQGNKHIRSIFFMFLINLFLSIYILTTTSLAQSKMPENLDLILAEVQKGDALLVDVRETSEWNSGHIKGAIHAPLSDLQRGIFPQKLTANKKIYTYCRSGNRSMSAEIIFKRIGVDNVQSLASGFNKLVDNGFTAE